MPTPVREEQRPVCGGGDAERQVWKGRDLETDESLRSAANISVRVCVCVCSNICNAQRTSQVRCNRTSLFRLEKPHGRDGFRRAAMATGRGTILTLGTCAGVHADAYRPWFYSLFNTTIAPNVERREAWMMNIHLQDYNRPETRASVLKGQINYNFLFFSYVSETHRGTRDQVNSKSFPCCWLIYCYLCVWETFPSTRSWTSDTTGVCARARPCLVYVNLEEQTSIEGGSVSVWELAFERPLVDLLRNAQRVWKDLVFDGVK